VDDLEGYLLPVLSAISATAGLLVLSSIMHVLIKPYW